MNKTANVRQKQHSQQHNSAGSS